MSYDNIEEKRALKKKKVKKLKTGLTIAVICSVVLLIACVASAFALFNMNDKIEELSTKVSSAQNEMEELRSTSDELTLQYNSLIAEKEQLSKDRDYLAEENLKLNQDLLELQGKAQSIEDLESQIQEKNNRISELESKIKSLNGTISRLETQIKNLKAQISGTDPSTEIQNPEDTGKYAYLTFDDGISDATNDILDILKEYNVKATLFVNFAYKKVSGYKEIYQRIIDEGHALGNHTNTHDYDDSNTVYGSIESFEKEVMDIHNSIKELTGYEMTLFRFPGGSNTTYNKLGTAPHTLIHELGYEYYDWNVDSGDAKAHNVPKETLVKNVLNGATSNSAIILMHDLGYRYKRTTVEALPEIIEGLIEKGYTLKALDESVTPRQFTKDPEQ